jgi:large subunit ribosomal protein L24
MATSKIKKGDMVIVTTGDAKGQKGKVLSVLKLTNRVVVEGVNMQKKFAKSVEGKKPGTVVETPASMHISNVAHIDPKDNKATRVGFKVEGDKKVRVAKKSGSVIK